MQDATAAHPTRAARRSPEAMQARATRIAHEQRCRRLPPVGSAEAEQLVAAFLAAKGGVTSCPPAYAVALQGA